MCGECSNILHLGHRFCLIHPRNVCDTSQGSTPFILGKYSIHPRKVSGSSLALTQTCFFKCRRWVMHVGSSSS